MNERDPLGQALAEGWALQRSGRLQEAEQVYRRVLKASPRHAAALHLLGTLAYQVGNTSAAIDLVVQAIAADPVRAAYQNDLGVIYKASGRLDRAVSCYESAIRLQPGFPEAYNNLGVARFEAGDLQAAADCYRRALASKPDYAEAHNNLGNALASQGRIDEALIEYHRVVELRPELVEAHVHLGRLLIGAGRAADGIAAYRRAVGLQPDNAALHFLLGTALQEQGRIDEAIACLMQATQLRPEYAEAHNNLGNAYTISWRLEEAAASLNEALRLEPELAEAHNSMGNVRTVEGDIRSALACYRRALELSPRYTSAHTNLLLTLNYDPDAAPEALLLEHRRWAEQQAGDVERQSVFENLPEPDRTLRVGYLSPDFRNHPVGRFFRPVLEHHDPHACRTFCYAEDFAPDDVTARLKSTCSAWRSISGRTDAEVADLVRRDAIDILVTLSGHTRMSRLTVFARKPAPIQVNYLGYPNTTGLDTVDYMITDEVLDPPGERSWYTEELLRLPGGFCCFAPPESAPPQTTLPALANGCITFGSLHNFAKVNDAVFELWGRLLEAVPRARLLIYRNILTDAMQERLRRRLAGLGFPVERLDLVRATDADRGFLSGYHGIDVGLDAFPFSGHTTTCESLWMGVPVLTLSGNRRAGRMSSSILRQVGLDEWVTKSPDEFVARGVALTSDVERLAALRRELRTIISRSSLCDAAGFTRGLEAAYRWMWQRWCGKRVGSST